MASIRFTDQDRDERGFVAIPARNPEPRSLADLLPIPTAPTPAQPPVRPMSKVEIASLIVVAILAAGVLIYSWTRGGDAPAAAPQRLAPTAQSSGERTVTPSPLPATAPAAAGRLLIAFAAPDGQLLGAIESTRAITPTAHYGDGWIQANVSGSGLVWLRASDSPELAIVGPNLAPRPTARPLVATPESQPPCLTAGTGARVVTVCGWGDLAAEARARWVEQYGGNLGIVTTPTPWNGGIAP